MKKENKKKVIEELLNGLTYSEISKKTKLKIKTIKKIEDNYLKNNLD